MPTRSKLLVLALLLCVGPLEAEDPDRRLRLVGFGGRASDVRPGEFSEAAGLALARDYAFAPDSRFAFSGELYPLLLVQQSTRDRNDREVQAAVAAAGLVAYRGGARGAGWGFRIEVGTGFFYGWSGPVPADGTRFNFYSQAGASIRFRAAGAWTPSVGYRWIHVSNLSLFPDKENPGLSIHAFVLAIESD